MKETGIIMSGNHPKLILDGIKTQTRRVIKPQPENELSQYSLLGVRYWRDENLNLNEFPYGDYTLCPYGQVGDRLWVRETWSGQDFAICTKDNKPNYKGKDGYWHLVIHKAGKENYAWGLQGEPKWKSGRFMFKSSTRIWLEITEVRVERVQEISETDCEREGTPMVAPRPSGVDRNDFHILWDSLNAKRGYGWEVNPWVWVISFKVV